MKKWVDNSLVFGQELHWGVVLTQRCFERILLTDFVKCYINICL